MSAKFARPLHTITNAHHFVTNVLGFADKDVIQLGHDINSTGKLAQLIMQAESLASNVNGSPTLNSTDHRLPEYRSESSRIKLRQKIFEELITLERIDDDDNIAFGFGGARPKTDPKCEKKAYLITGLPASGKSSIVNKLADDIGAFVIDSDFAKRKFPEFSHVQFGASVVHAESQLVTVGDTRKPNDGEVNLYEFCISKGYNMIIPKIGYNHKTIESFRDDLMNFGYEVHLTLVRLERVESTKRALKRFLETQRYVSLSLVFDSYANDPILSYYKTRSCHKWASYGKVYTGGPPFSSPKFEEGNNGNPSCSFR